VSRVFDMNKLAQFRMAAPVLNNCSTYVLVSQCQIEKDSGF
jgi:hypothetical protein